MAETLCTLRKRGGGGMNGGTVLWTNSAPSSTFARQNITISDMSGYNYIKVVFRIGTGIATELSSIFSVADLQKSTSSYPVYWYFGTSASYAEWIRSIEVVDNTTMTISDSRSWNYTATDNTWTIPVQIIGLK